MAGTKDILTGLPIVGGFWDDSEELAMEELKKNQGLYDAIGLPTFGEYKPEDYRSTGQLTPAMAQSSAISEDPSLRSSQLGVLNKLAGLSETGLSDVDQAGFERARQLGGQMARSGTQAALQNAQARGVGGSGMEFALREMASQEGAGRAQIAGLEQSAQSANQRALYNQAYGNSLGALRGQDFSANAANADILNKFNMYNTGNQNQANMYNVQNAQNLSNMSTAERNKAQQYANQMAQQQYQNQLQKAQGQAGANTGAFGGYAAQNAGNAADRNANAGLIMQGIGMAAGAGGKVAPKKKPEPVEKLAGEDYSDFGGYV